MSIPAEDRHGEARFTITELMVVVVILFVLAALSLAALDQARHKSKQAACLEQLRQIGTALYVYAADNDNRLPRCAALTTISPALPSLPRALGDQTGKNTEVFHCPADSGRRNYLYSDGHIEKTFDVLIK